MTRVLIVDDQPAFRRRFGEMIVRAGLEVVAEAGDIFEAERLVRECQPDLAVVDIMLPTVNGLEGALRLKAAIPSLRIILISAYRDAARVFQISAEAVGAEAFFSKDDLDENVIRAWIRSVN